MSINTMAWISTLPTQRFRRDTAIAITCRCLAVAALAALACFGAARAQLTVVANHGGRPARPYYVAISGAGVSERAGYHVPAGPAGERAFLPVTTSRLSPGRVTARSLSLPPGTTPFFIIGSGPMSRRWLIQRRAKLRQLGAVGLVVNVKTVAALKRLRRIACGLELRPVRGGDLARRLHLSHYPLLVTAHGVQQ